MDQHQRFIQLRACGWSYAKIAEELKISKPTLIKWGRQNSLEINNQRLLEEEHVKEKLGLDRLSRLSRFAMVLKKLEEVVERADFSQIPPAKAIELWTQLHEHAVSNSGPVVFEGEADIFDFAEGNLKRWVG